MKEYTIDEKYLTQITVEYGFTYPPNEFFPDGGFGTTTSNVDHPSFTALREHLGETGMIRIERCWWNGDRVLTPFTLNGIVFNEGDKFVSAGAMKYELKHKGNDNEL